MDVDALVRRVCALAVPALAIAAWLLRAEPPARGTSTGTGPLPEGSGAAPAPAPRAASTGDLSRLGERALAPKAEPARPVLAADLPTSQPPSHRESPPARARPRAATGECGGLEVRLITASDDEKWAFASIAEGLGTPARFYRVGERVGSWRLASIEWDRVWLQAGGARCAIGMHPGVREARESAGRGAQKQGVAIVDRAPPWQVSESIAESIEKISETEYRIKESAVSEIFEHSADLLAGLSVQPLRRDEQLVGIELSTIPSDSLLERLGVLSGDVLLALGDTRCISLESTLAALGELREKRQLVARLERDGAAFELDVRVE
jgi:general secretion pathway protein C